MEQSISSDPKHTAAPPVLLRGLISADGRLSHSLYSLGQPYLPRWALLLLELSADFRLFFPISLSLLLLPASDPQPLLRPFLAALLLGLLLDLAAVGLLKILVRRARPHYNRGMSAAVAADHFSFPSGHSSRVFFVAALLHLSGVGLFPAAVWAWAAATSVSRVFLGRHFVIDVLAGACFGVLEGLFAFRFLRIASFQGLSASRFLRR